MPDPTAKYELTVHLPKPVNSDVDGTPRSHPTKMSAPTAKRLKLTLTNRATNDLGSVIDRTKALPSRFSPFHTASSQAQSMLSHFCH